MHRAIRSSAHLRFFPLGREGLHRGIHASYLSTHKCRSLIATGVFPFRNLRHPPRTATWNRRISVVTEATEPSVVVLFFSSVPVEPTFSAAGVRSRYLLTQLSREPLVESVHILSPSDASKPATAHCDAVSKDVSDDSLQVFQYHTLLPNRAEGALELLQKLCPSSEKSDTVILALFDRYYSEEMFSFYLHKLGLDNVVFVLDMQDMHSLRQARQRWVREKHRNLSHNDDVLEHTIPSPEEVVPDIRDDDTLLRELASIHRCDLTLVCSPFEYDLLTHHYQIPDEKVCVAPLFGGSESLNQPTLRSFAERRDFVFVGGMKHPPNVDGIRELKRLWPLIRQRCASQEPLPSLFIYGAQCSDQLRSELHDPVQGFLMQGYVATTIDEVLLDKRVLLSPLRFGAGIKGKHVDAWRCGVPVVTTSMGSEGMHDDDASFGGRIANTDRAFIDAAAALYNHETEWMEAVGNISPSRLLALCADWERIAPRIWEVLRQKDERRSRDIIQHILWHQSNRSAEYFSKYIECKERNRLPVNSSS